MDFIIKKKKKDSTINLTKLVIFLPLEEVVRVSYPKKKKGGVSSKA